MSFLPCTTHEPASGPANPRRAMALVVIGLNHHSAPVALRERFAFEEARVPAVLEMLRGARVAEEAVILSTCNRVEIYAVTASEPPAAFEGLREFLMTCQSY